MAESRTDGSMLAPVQNRLAKRSLGTVVTMHVMARHLCMDAMNQSAQHLIIDRDKLSKAVFLQPPGLKQVAAFSDPFPCAHINNNDINPPTHLQEDA